MGSRGDQDLLMRAAQVAFPAEEVLGAAIFGWQDLVKAQIVGGTAGAIAGDMALGGAGGAVGAGVGGYLIKQEMAAEHGMTLQLLVTVSATRVHVSNWQDDRAGDQILAFDREQTEVHVKRFGLSRIVHLHDSASGADIKLHASVASYLPQSGPDKAVLRLLQASS